MWDVSELEQEQSRMYVCLPYLVVPVHAHGTAGTGYGMATGQSFKHHTHTHTTHGPNTTGIPIPVTNPTGRPAKVYATGMCHSAYCTFGNQLALL